MPPTQKKKEYRIVINEQDTYSNEKDAQARLRELANANVLLIHVDVVDDC